MAVRPGIGDCIRTLELSHYAPGTRRNDLFFLRFIEWGHMGWFIVSIPKIESAFMVSASTAHGLRVANGIPTMLSGGHKERFPIIGKNVFTLENVRSHPVYKSKPR